MGKKRKAGRPFGQVGSSENPGKTKYAVDEEFADSEDEFNRGKDKILLDDGPQAKRRRRVQETSDVLEPSDEEVLGYDSDAEDEDDIELTEEEADPANQSKLVDDDSSSAKSGSGDEEEANLGHWGSSKQDYYNADAIETEADALEEEEEARKIQQKRLLGMTEADFGFDETEWLDLGQDVADGNEEQGRAITEILPQLEIDESLGPSERVKILNTRYPEFEPLAKDFVDLQSVHENLRLAAAAADAVMRCNTAIDTKALSPLVSTPAAIIKHRALSSYLGALGMYFALLSSPGRNSLEPSLAMAPADLREHPIMDSLFRSRKLWEEARDLPVPDVAELAVSKPELPSNSATVTNGKAAQVQDHMKSPKQKKKTKAERRAEKARAEEAAVKAERVRKVEEDLVDLSSLIQPSETTRTQGKLRVQPLPLANAYDDSDLGDEAPLTAQEAADKAKRKKTLRFYTSEIAQKASKRGAAGRDAGGDADIPYKERLKDRQARLVVEAEKRGQRANTKGQELGGESDDEDRQVAEELRNEAGDDDEDYDMMASRNKKRRAEKREGKVQKADSSLDRVVEAQVGPDGKRAITYAMEKNKGLTPKRNKDVRNPRVKKRKKYDEKKKKLGSTRQVYKGGEGKGGYGGELTGIKKNLIRSVKL